MKRITVFLMGVAFLAMNAIAFTSYAVDPESKVTCYSTYGGTGTTTITKCNGCVEQSNVNTYTDEGTCRP